MEKIVALLLGLVLCSSISLYLLYNGDLIDEVTNSAQTTAYLFGMVILTALVISQWFLSLSRIQSWDKGYLTRSSLIFILLSGSIGLLSYGLEKLVESHLANFEGNISLKGIFIGCILSLILVWIDYSWLAFTRYSKETIREIREKRKKEELQFDLLKSQLTPHFLFNSLNSATVLLSHHPEKVEEYIRKLAYNFSNLIHYGFQPLNNLERELEIIDNYMHLMQVRYGEKVILEKNIRPDLNTKLIPALGLQLLVENALKHNVASLEQPVKILVTADEEKVAVANTITSKPMKVSSSGVGLKNLKERYKYHGNSQPNVFQMGGFYYVCLPYVSKKASK